MGDAVAEHIYLSTACLHGEHGYCQADTGQCGAKTPGVCKFCSAPCVCDCHRSGSGRERSPCPLLDDDGNEVERSPFHPRPS